MEPGTHTFLPTSRVRFGAGSLGRLEEEARSFERAFVVTGRTLYEKTDLVRRVEGLLGEKHAGTYVGMSEHTPGSAVEEAAGRAGDADLLVGVGGGSVIDGTKAVAVRLGYPFQVAVPTTLSGAEWAHRVGVTDEAKGRKAGFADERAVPPVVILDPQATVFTPERLWLSTGIRALDHAVEGFLDTLARAYISPERDPLPPPDLSSLRAAGIPTQSDAKYAAATGSTVRRRRLLAAFLADDGWVGDPSTVRGE